MTNIKSILVTGANGQLGQCIQDVSTEFEQFDFTFVNRAQLDLSDSDQIAQFFQRNQFDLIINCAAYTAVDQAETEQAQANQVNHLAVKQLAEIANASTAKLIHVSTDYVFNGQQFRPYIESDQVNPQSVYGTTKLQGEQAIQQIMAANATIIRTSWIYSQYGNNFVKTMLKLGKERGELHVVFDQVGTPTYALDLAKSIMTMVACETFNLKQCHNQIFHFSNEGVCSWYDFAQTIFQLAGIDCKLSPIVTEQYPTPATRPHYSVLNKMKIKQAYSLNIPYWKDALRRCLQQLQG